MPRICPSFGRGGMRFAFPPYACWAATNSLRFQFSDDRYCQMPKAKTAIAHAADTAAIMSDFSQFPIMSFPAPARHFSTLPDRRHSNEVPAEPSSAKLLSLLGSWEWRDLEAALKALQGPI